MTAQRVARFVAIGAAGFAVQIAVGVTALAAGLTPVLATLLAIEAAIVSNHAWYRRWAWHDRAATLPWRRTLLRVHAGAGGTSLVVGAGAVALLDDRVPPLLAQLIAVALCAVVNYRLADRWVFGRRADAALAALALCLWTPSAVCAAGPSRDAVQSWDRYGSMLSRLRDDDRARGIPSWATDGDPAGARVLGQLLRGEPDVTRRTLPDIEVDDATLEHWQGSVLVRGATIAQVQHRLRHPERYPQPRDVLDLKVSDRSEAGHALFLRLTRSLLITATYDTWHRVRHDAHSAHRVDSTAIATRIEEVTDPGQPGEKRVPVDQGRGFLWRMRSVWRFEAIPQGVVVTCESITLSRPVPVGLGLMARPIVARVARESMTTAVQAWQAGWR